MRSTSHCEKGKASFSYDDAYIYYNDGSKEEAHQDKGNVIEGGKDYWGFMHSAQISNFYNAILGIEELDISGEKCLKTHRLICDLYQIGRGNL